MDPFILNLTLSFIYYELVLPPLGCELYIIAKIAIVSRGKEIKVALVGYVLIL